MHSFIKYLYHYTRSSWWRGGACEKLRFECHNRLLLYISLLFPHFKNAMSPWQQKKNHNRKKHTCINEICIPRVQQFVIHLFMVHNLSNFCYFGLKEILDDMKSVPLFPAHAHMLACTHMKLLNCRNMLHLLCLLQNMLRSLCLLQEYAPFALLTPPLLYIAP